MFSRTNLESLEQYFIPYTKRKEPGVYFCRLTVYTEEIHKVICRFIETTRLSGICISPKIGNPDEKQLDYYNEIMGHEFLMNPNFFYATLKKWIPRVPDARRMDISNCLYDVFLEMAKNGKNESMQKNAYIKFMCWMYYRFEPILHQLGKDSLPKILYEGNLNEYELKMLSILSKAGCDILVLEYDKDEKYQQIDKESRYSQLISQRGGPFPPGYAVLELRKQMFTRVNEPQLKAFRIEKSINTNTWIKGDPFADVLFSQPQRGSEPQFFYNLFAGVYGVENQESYYLELFKWKMKLEGMGKQLLIIENGFEPPSYEEINTITRKNYNSPSVLINDMVQQIRVPDKGIMVYCQNAFMAWMAKAKELPVQKLLNLAVVMVCWLNRYAVLLFKDKAKESILLYYGSVKSDHERMLLDMLALTPVDILIVNPEGEEIYPVASKLFFLKQYPERVKKETFPAAANAMQFETVAYQAEQELNTIMYQDTGMYRNRQFQDAVPVPLQVIYEEISILWNQEAKYRPNFETFSDKVMVPVIFAKVSGVKATTEEYWADISMLAEKDTYVMKSLPHLGQTANPFKEKAYTYLNGGKLIYDKIKSSPQYPFAILRDNIQNYILKKIQELIDSKIIVGTGNNGVENLILATILNLDKELIRLIQNYDFTRNIPKALVLHTGETSASLEDGILLAYLNQLGFDIAMFVPTGYNCVERYYTKEIFVEHQIGDYKYDLQVPNLDAVRRKKEGFANRLFRRGR